MVRVTALSSPFLLGFDDIERALDKVSKTAADGYPPYNIERIPASSPDPEKLRITLAVAGFQKDEIEVTVEENQLVIRGRQQEDKTREYLHRGIAARQFQRSFLLAEGMQVLGADLSQGLLVDRSRPAAAGAGGEDNSDIGARLRLRSEAGSRRTAGKREAMRMENDKALALTPQEFAHLGDGAVAYVKTINSEDVTRLFPQAPAASPRRQAVRSARRRRLAHHADRLQGRGDRQRLGTSVGDCQSALRRKGLWRAWGQQCPRLVGIR